MDKCSIELLNITDSIDKDTKSLGLSQGFLFKYLGKTRIITVHHFKSIIASYGDIEKSSGLEAKISDIYTFGNNVFIKVLFSGKNIVTKIKDFQEEWTFSKSLIQAGPDWFLTNIERPQ